MPIAAVQADALRLDHARRTGTRRDEQVPARRLGREPFPAEHGQSAFDPIFGAVFIRKAQPRRPKSALALELKVVARAGQVVGVIIEIAVHGTPETGIPIALEAEVALIR